MRNRFLVFSILFFAPTFVYGACSVSNLTRCLDSVCAINIGANPAARCQYCGSSSAGEPTKSTVMKNITAGTSAKYTISEKQLKKAPKDPGERYVWGTKLCLEKLKDCTPDDVTDNYDSLIEQSCKAAGISAEMENLVKNINKEKTQTACSTDITACMIDIKRCNGNYSKCSSDTDFDKYFSECSIESLGCDSFLTDIRKTIMTARNSAIANAGKILQGIVDAYKNARDQKLKAAQLSCKNNKAKNDCIQRVCGSNVRNKCAAGYTYERTIAEQLCKFYDTACERLK